MTPDTLGVGEEVTIRWNYEDGNGGSLGRFDIALYACDDAFCGQQDCGTFVEELCDKPGAGCLDGSGDYVTTVPDVIPGRGYKIRVGLHGSPLFDCTSTFSITQTIPIPSLEVYVPTSLGSGEAADFFDGDDDDASLTVESLSTGRRGLRSSGSLSSSSGPQLEAGTASFAANDTIVAKWSFDDGLRRTFARFNIDLYYCGGGCSFADNCGQIIARLCEACPDSDGSEVVTLPNVYSSHNYKIRVSTWSSVRRPASSCSPKFEIRGRDRPEYSTPPPTPLPDSNEASLYPRPPATAPPSEDLPTDPVVLPTEFPDWGEQVVAPAQPNCDSDAQPEVRYASTTARIYVEHVDDHRGGCFTLTDIYESGSRPLYPIDPTTNERTTTITGVWLLTEELYILDGITLQLHGRERGGDCDELRLLSDETTFLNLRAHGGSISFLGTKVTSWDEGKGTVDSNHEDGRSYISCVSEVIYDPLQTCNGTAKSTRGEARMDVIDSEIAYLGYYESESYGLVWKVRGFCVDKSNPDVFDNVNVYGDMINSDIHHNYFGHYSYGHQGGNWSYNKMHDNVEYGFDPHDDSDYLHIVGNDVWGNGNHGIIASKRCNHVKITDNHVYQGVNTGLFLHRSSDHAIVTGNHVHNNGDAGLAVLESFYMDVNNNVFKNNRFGIRFSVGSRYNWIHDNIFAGSSSYNFYTYLGSDLPDVEGSDGFSDGIVFWRNYLSGTYLESIRLKEARSTVVVNNRVASAATISFDECYDTLFRDNEAEEFLEPIIKGAACFAPESDFEPACD
eukprot:g17738.t1